MSQPTKNFKTTFDEDLTLDFKLPKDPTGLSTFLEIESVADSAKRITLPVSSFTPAVNPTSASVTVSYLIMRNFFDKARYKLVYTANDGSTRDIVMTGMIER